MVRVIIFGAHPDDCEILAGGTAAKWAAAGSAVLAVSLTNGDIGHFDQAGGPLARRRAEEIRRAGEVLGIKSISLDNHDGELVPSLENRRAVTRLIREWKADVVISHRPNDYHPDHRSVGILVQDAGYMVTVPFWCADVPHLRKNPAFFFSRDGFRTPNPFRPDIVVSIDDQIEKKRSALACLESALEFVGFMDAQGAGEPDDRARARALTSANRAAVLEQWIARFSTADGLGPALEKWYGKEKAAVIRHAEPFEICEYGRQPDEAELRTLFPLS